MADDFGRDRAWALLTEWTAGESLRKHALAVEACVVAYGERPRRTGWDWRVRSGRRW